MSEVFDEQQSQLHKRPTFVASEGQYESTRNASVKGGIANDLASELVPN
jgi:hypothetical protein